ncbi:MotA/TolQ/ExbB proton channel family protein [Vibrio salinus]|uniref:MotA/TolQ/ExbB proton channel family protein n=1 Tax=Vibrio salinus TaxID=2899784 RepID=UPI001E4C8D86|nr:MotA/TolQ/ExbB proton channel family protein [Vibrio salinus]MCE0492510.1 MotA/TolQ/ExbB proton channel family protein [Vibrio salinus]
MRLLTIITLISCIFSIGPVSAESLTHLAQDHKRQEQIHNEHREATFKQSEANLRLKKQNLQKKKRALQKEIDQLTKKFSQNEDKLARLEKKLSLESGSLGEIFGVVRQNAKEFQSGLSNSVTTADHAQFNSVIKQIVSAKSLPSLKQLTDLSKAFAEQIYASNEIKEIKVPFINHQGQKQTQSVIRLGNLALIGKNGYLNWDSNQHEAVSYLVQPDMSPTVATLSPLLAGNTQYLPVDPSRGVIISQLANEPTLADRLKAGGVIGKIIIGLLIIGLIIAITRGISLSINKQKIRKQLKTPDIIGNNPLGRVLSVYKKDEPQTVEALELRLLEAVVDEQSNLDKGLSMLKLLAALAPMLGLLGTVTGMIETFQVITMFGNGDPKVMAGGISMALVTTVLGLVAAMPLLLAHNILSSQSESIRNILEKQGISLVATQAEKDGRQSLSGKTA